MRTYPPNSPEAAARVLVMALLADGHCAMTEIQALDRLQAPRRLGLSPARFKGVLDDFCQDVLTAHQGRWLGSIHIDAGVRDQLVGEITDLRLQNEVMGLCTDIIHADAHLAEGEIHMIDTLVAAWPGRTGFAMPESKALAAESLT